MAGSTGRSWEQALYPKITKNFAVTGTTNGLADDSEDAISDGIRIVRLYATVACHVAFGPYDDMSPLAATTADMPIAAGVDYFFRAPEGSDIAAIKQSGEDDGVLYVTEMTAA